jgi:hypothetical protein
MLREVEEEPHLLSGLGVHLLAMADGRPASPAARLWSAGRAGYVIARVTALPRLQFAGRDSAATGGVAQTSARGALVAQLSEMR